MRTLPFALAGCGAVTFLVCDNPVVPGMTPGDQAWWMPIDAAALTVGLILIVFRLLKKDSSNFVVPS